MSSLKEKYQAAQARIHPKGLLFGGALIVISPWIMQPVQGFLTFGIHELGRDINTDTMKLLAIAMLAIANSASIILESQTLEKRKYSASPVAGAFNILTGQPAISSAAAHAINFTRNLVINPVNVANIAAAATGDQGRLFFENAAAVGLTLCAWNMVNNTLVLTGHTQPVINGVKKIKTFIGNHIKH